MEVMSQRRLFPTSSALNPNAAMFVPMAYRAVEDYSEQWWSLVQSSPWFRHYWLQERFQDPQLTDLDDPDIDALFDNFSAKQDHLQEEKKYCEDLISMGAFKWRKGRRPSTPTRPRKS